MTVKDTTTLRELLPPLPGESWEDYTNRAIAEGLMSGKEKETLFQTYGTHAFQKTVSPITPADEPATF